MRKTLEEKLETKYERMRYRIAPLIYICHTGTDGVGYGSFKDLPSKKELSNRLYVLEDCDYDVAIRFLDVLYDPRNYRKIYMM